MDFIVANNIVKEYSGYKALDGLNITVKEGTVYGLLGPNGAGKTTLIRILNQITKPDSGEVFFNGRPLRPNDVNNIGYLPEERGLYKKMKVGEQALYLAQLKGLSKHDALVKLKYWFEKFQIEAWWNKRVEELSKGMQQKVQFIVTVLHEPKLLIFDEPFSGFDPINANLLKNEIIELKDKGATVLFSTHNMSSVEEVCDNITLINKSKDVLSGSVAEIKELYKNNTYNIRFKGDFEALQTSDNFSILSKNCTNGYNHATIKAHDNTSANELLRNLIDRIELAGFEEILPSINDIFIKVVGKSEEH